MDSGHGIVENMKKKRFYGPLDLHSFSIYTLFPQAKDTDTQNKRNNWKLNFTKRWRRKVRWWWWWRCRILMCPSTFTGPSVIIFYSNVLLLNLLTIFFLGCSTKQIPFACKCHLHCVRPLCAWSQFHGQTQIVLLAIGPNTNNPESSFSSGSWRSFPLEWWIWICFHFNSICVSPCWLSTVSTALVGLHQFTLFEPESTMRNNYLRNSGIGDTLSGSRVPALDTILQWFIIAQLTHPPWNEHFQFNPVSALSSSKDSWNLIPVLLLWWFTLFSSWMDTRFHLKQAVLITIGLVGRSVMDWIFSGPVEEYLFAFSNDNQWNISSGFSPLKYPRNGNNNDDNDRNQSNNWFLFVPFPVCVFFWLHRILESFP